MEEVQKLGKEGRQRLGYSSRSPGAYTSKTACLISGLEAFRSSGDSRIIVCNHHCKERTTMAQLGNIWEELYDKPSKLQGWALFEADGVMSIQALDDPYGRCITDAEEKALKKSGQKTLKDDNEAVKVVVKNASKGCKMCLLALFLDGKSSDEDADLWIPDVLVPTQAERRKLIAEQML